MVEQCPACGGGDVHHSRLRNWTERLRWRLTSRVPFRCHQCDWRGWRDETVARRPSGQIDATERILHRDISDDDIDQLDGGAPGSLT